MYNFNNLSDFEFEMLCKDIMQKKLGIDLYTFSKGRDGGIDITDNPSKLTLIIQVKHYINSKYTDLVSSLKKEVDNVKKLQPQKYYICCAVRLTANNKKEIYEMFSDYMESANDVMSLLDINDFLERSENIDIVRKNYKLWLESTDILSEIANQSVFVDCESLLYNIEESSKEFVASNLYYECLEILNQERMLLLLGMPGTGKTITTKMLALYYASERYRIRYTTNGDIKDLKNALSTQKDLKEVVLLDDCLGQHYFRMKETQENELLGLVKYISMNKNKKLIMNSRVTIFNQANERSVEFRHFVEDKRFKIKVLDMNQLSILDKGRIFHNHVYFKKLPLAYYREICRDYNYREIVKHKNYTPRIMEFVTRKVNYKNVPSEQYFIYIMKCLDNPTEIWHDEFSEKLQQEDRVLLTTLYSLTDTSIIAETLKRAFNHRLSHTMTIDTSRNIWEDVIKRLEGAFIIIIEKNGKKEIGVINPSVNDFLKEYLQKNDIERENIKENAIEYEQIKRGFSERMEDIIRNGKAASINYPSSNERLFVILSYICKLGVLNDCYKCFVESFFESLPYGVFEGMLNRCEIAIILLSTDFEEFYNTYACIDKETLINFLRSMDLDEYQSLITTAQEYGIDFFYTEYRDVFIDAINVAIIAYMEHIDADNYYVKYDIDDLLVQNMKFSGPYEELDEEGVTQTICEWIKDDVEEEVFELTKDLPQDILSNINIVRNNININMSDIESFIDSYFEPPDLYDDYRERNFDYGGINEMSILDCIFK
ncbi:MAG: restriction endonuclease [Acetatifactor sp.]|nr:restriction endonuclease [Acetatifactor sp.]